VILKKYTIALSSITYAIKAQNLLKYEGIKTEVIRTPKNLAFGCGYSIVLYGDIDKALAILERNHINQKGIMES
jgi:hypothetical protein